MTSDGEVAAMVAGVRREVAGRRMAGGYSTELLRGLDSEFIVAEHDHASAPEALAHVPSGRPLRGSGVVGRLSVAAKRILRRTLAWYVDPITVDQSRFNAAITAELRRLERRIDSLDPGEADDLGSESRHLPE